MAGIRLGGRVVALVSMLILGAVTVAVPATADGNDPSDPFSVTWAAATYINPDTMTYEVVTTGTDPATDRFLVGGVTTPVDADGSTVVQLPSVAGGAVDYRAILQRCTPTCTALSKSETLHIRNEILPHPRWTGLLGSMGPERRIDVAFDLEDVGGVQFEWRVYEAPYVVGSAEIASGASEDDDDPFWQVEPLGDIGLVEGASYELHIDFVAETAWGPLPGELSGTFTWDESIDMQAQLGSPALFYPVRGDQYLDSVYAKLTWGRGDRPVYTVLQALDASGDKVFERRYVDGVDPQIEWSSWNGRRTSGALAPEGDYELVLTAWDDARNTYTFRTDVQVSHKELKLVDWRRTFRPAKVVSERHVGRCAALKQPARPNWRGSFGYRSRSSCARPQQTVVWTLQGVYIPYSLTDDYSVRISLFGGTARGARRSELRVDYVNRKDDWSYAGNFYGRVGLHKGYSIGERVVLGQEDERPYVLWAAGLGGGYNYDVKTFTLEVTYRTLTY